jgi:hypothetical protein
LVATVAVNGIPAAGGNPSPMSMVARPETTATFGAGWEAVRMEGRAISVLKAITL